MRAEPVSRPHAYHAEGVIWGDDWGDGVSALRYVDMLAGDVLQLREDGNVDRFHVGTVAAALRPRVGGGAVIGVERGFALARRTDLSDVTALPELWPADAEPRVRFNDGGCAPDGSFFMGSMAYDQREGAASMWRLAPDGSTTQAFGNVTISNGLAWSPDGTRAYYNDTPTGMVQVFDWSAETGLTNRRPFVRIEGTPGHPDGLTVDADGGVWVALYGGSGARRYDSDGTLSEVIEVGPSQVTCVGFGGADLRTLYLTTSRENLSEGDEPDAGALFACTPGVAGQRTIPFAG